MTDLLDDPWALFVLCALFLATTFAGWCMWELVFYVFGHFAIVRVG